MNAANAVKCAEDKYEDAFGTRSDLLIAELMSYYVVSSTYNANTQTFQHIIQPSGTGPKEVLYVGEMGMDNDPVLRMVEYHGMLSEAGEYDFQTCYTSEEAAIPEFPNYGATYTYSGTFEATGPCMNMGSTINCGIYDYSATPTSASSQSCSPAPPPCPTAGRRRQARPKFAVSA